MLLSPHFSTEESACHCGCGLGTDTAHVDPLLVNMLEQLRRANGDRPLRINSWCRCQAHNYRIGGSLNSAHCPDHAGVCHAVDIASPSSHETYLLVKAALEVGVQRIGVERGCVHVDTRSTLPHPVLFSYLTVSRS